MVLKNRKYFHFIVSLFFLFSAQLLNAQQMLTGVVYNRETGRGLSGANVIILDQSIGASTDADGNFTMDLSHLSPGKYTIVVNFVGYRDFGKEISIPLNNISPLEIPLSESAIYMDQVVVTGTRTEKILKDTPVTTQVIRGETITESGSSDMSEILSELTGVAISENPRFGSQVQLQGFDSNRILLLVDGQKIIGRLNGQLDISQFSTSEIERVEIVKGATSTIYGSEAMAGVINIITRKGGKLSNGSIDLRGGSYGKFNGVATYSVPFFGWTPKFTAGYRKYNGYDLDTKKPAQDGRAYEKFNGDLHVDGQITPGLNLNFKGSYFQEEQRRDLNEFFTEKSTNDRISYRLQIVNDSLISTGFKAGVEYSAFNHQYGEVVRSSGYYKKGDHTEDGLIRADVLLNRKYKTHFFDLGYSYENESIESGRIDGNKRESDLHNVFFQDELLLSPSFSFLFGARYDFHSIYGGHFSPKASLMISPTDNQRIRLSYGHGFRAPSFKELFLTLFVSDVNLIITGNPDLATEKSNAFNLDYEVWNNDYYHSRINFFLNNVFDLISDIRIDTGENSLNYTYTNFGEVKTWGAEWDMSYFPYDWLELSMGYSYLDSHVKETGQPLSGKAKHQAHAALMVDLPYGIKANIRTQYMGKKEDILINDQTGEVTDSIPVEAYNLIHINFSGKIYQNIKLYGGVRNLTDYVNKTWGPMPGREWYTGITYKF